MDYQFLQIEIAENIAEVVLNRPEKANALDMSAFQELEHAFEALDENPEVRVIILRGNGKHFCAGIDLSLLLGLNQHVQESCSGRKREKLHKLILQLQGPMNAAAACCKPILAAVQGACIGGGLDLVAACDMRYATEDAYFTIKEIDMGMVADLGALQRLPGIIGEGMLREMAFTGRKVNGVEAQRIG
ncbi:MAG TPA: enoyl-CoA hydratase, partial [Bacteroidetes bacterium]|nr:enoyl-CoA hydratase [Bacteroidota bacterium]